MLKEDARKDKKIVKPEVTASLLDDLLNIEAIVVILRERSLCVYDSWVGVHSIDAQLFSGLVSAITAMIGELGGKTKVRDRHSFLEFSQTAGDEDLTVWACLGKYTAITLILRRRSSKDLRRILASLVYEYESKLEDDLENFSGYLDDLYEKSEELLSNRLYFTFLSPMRLTKEPKSCPKEYQAVARVIYEEQRSLAASEGLYLRELASLAVRSLGNVPYRDILKQIIFLVDNGVLIPVEEAGKLSKVDLAIEAIDQVLAHDEIESEIEELSSSSADEAELPPASLEFDQKKMVETVSSTSLDASRLSEQLGQIDSLLDDNSLPKADDYDIKVKDADEMAGHILEILITQKIPDIPMKLAKDILRREIIYSEGMGKTLEVEMSEIDLNQVSTRIKGPIISEIKRNALEGPLFDTKLKSFTIRVSISKTTKEKVIFAESVI